MSDTYYKKTRWEGKSWAFKAKYMYANYPYFTASTALTFVLFVGAAAYHIPRFEKSRDYALHKYKADYIVVRDDDPNLDAIMEQKERGRHFFPKY